MRSWPSTRMAKARWTRDESRNRDKTHYLMTRAELEAQAPGFTGAAFLGAAGADREIGAPDTTFRSWRKL